MRGLIQLTGRANYKRYGLLLDLDLINNPMLALEPINAIKIACEFWKQKGLNSLADAGNISQITRRINGGLNGYDDRLGYYNRFKRALGI
jgi:putative chitinase